MEIAWTDVIINIPWKEIIFGIGVISLLSFVFAAVMKILIDAFPGNLDEERDDVVDDFVVFELKKRELDTMMKNLQSARENLKEMTEQIDKRLGGGRA